MFFFIFIFYFLFFLYVISPPNVKNLISYGLDSS